MMNKILLSAALATAMFANGGFTAAGGSNANQGGFTGNGSAKLVSVKEALNLKDDAPVILQGKIKSQIKSEHYNFVDKNGDTIEIEIDNDKWMGVKADENTLLEITGEVDKGFTNTSIDVKRVSIVK